VDDIEDSSQLRRGAPCIHLRHGLNVAINAANTLYFLPFLHLLDHPTVGDPKRHRICEILLRNCVRAHFGQGHDIFWSNHLDPHSLALWLEDKLPEKILQMYHYKTGAAVEGLAEIACIIAEADAAVTEACKDFGRSFSVAFQIMDDIHNFSDLAEWTKRCAEDLAEGKLTYVMVNALRMLEERDRERLAQIVCSKTLRQEADGQGEACELMRRSGALESCRSEAQMLAQRSWEKFAKALPNSWPRMILRMMTLRLLRQDFGCGSP
jgi:geranylgeranyl diphosphate synthase type 3/geranylgeranyl diphosphate synthase type I